MNKFFSKFLVIILILSMITACGDSKVIDGKQYETYGIINRDEVRNPKIEYQLITGNVVWGIILFETVVAPIYFFGFSIYEPIEKIPPDKG
jgi:hypothetical protein